MRCVGSSPSALTCVSSVRSRLPFIDGVTMLLHGAAFFSVALCVFCPCRSDCPPTWLSNRPAPCSPPFSLFHVCLCSMHHSLSPSLRLARLLLCASAPRSLLVLVSLRSAPAPAPYSAMMMAAKCFGLASSSFLHLQAAAYSRRRCTARVLTAERERACWCAVGAPGARSLDRHGGGGATVAQGERH